MSMLSFEQILLRLKLETALRSDHDIAGFLGISATALSQRKRRGAFPEYRLRSAVQQRPELSLDVPYVLTGIRGIPQILIDADKASPFTLPVFDEMAAFMDAEMARTGIAQGATA